MSKETQNTPKTFRPFFSGASGGWSVEQWATDTPTDTQTKQRARETRQALAYHQSSKVPREKNVPWYQGRGGSVFIFVSVLPSSTSSPLPWSTLVVSPWPCFLVSCPSLPGKRALHVDAPLPLFRTFMIPTHSSIVPESPAAWPSPPARREKPKALASPHGKARGRRGG